MNKQEWQLAAWRDQMCEAEDMMAIMLKEKNYIGLKHWLNRYFTAQTKLEAGRQILEVKP